MTGPAIGTKTNKYKQTKNRIIETYLNLMKKKRWDKISVKEICFNVNITRGTFYQYFSDIYDLMEQIEASLLNDIKKRYEALPKQAHPSFPVELFEDKFNYAPPLGILTWFEFCKSHKKAIAALLNQKYGDSYFVKKLKNILSEKINQMMDEDGMPHDALRSHFVKILLELHFLSVCTWLEAEEGDFLSIKEIINLLNTMRVGANYLTYKRLVSSDFDTKMEIPDRKGY